MYKFASRPCIAVICLIIALTAFMPGRKNAHAAEPNPLLSGVVAVLPDVPLVVRGDVQKRNARGRIESTYRVDMVLDWKADVPTARYTIRDAFGQTLQHLAITWQVSGEPEYQYFEGFPLRAAPLPPLNDTIQNTDITWLDLSLSFLWWPGGERRGRESVRGRECEIIDVPAPANHVMNFDGVRLWVETRLGIVMRAEGFDVEGKLKRRMEVRSFKKIRDRWVIKDIDFQSFPSRSRTTLLVRDVEERERFQLPDRDSLSHSMSSWGEDDSIDELPEGESLEPDEDK